MKRLFECVIFFLLGSCLYSCKDFLEVKPIDKFSGEEFWRNREDAEKAVNSCYALLYKKMNASPLYNCADIRPGNWNFVTDKYDFIAFAKNDMNSPELHYLYSFGEPISSWLTFYQCIAACNLCIDRIPKIENDNFGSKDRKAMVAEARFIRSFVYFFMVRMYGDIPIHNDAYDVSNKPREDMLNVLDTCLQDLDIAKENLPVSYPDPTNRAVKATKGAALTLISHIYMWKAGFDKANQEAYWKKAAEAAKEVMDLGVYKLVPYDEKTSETLFKGRSEEGIFELSMSDNYGNTTGRIICWWTLHLPVLNTSTLIYGGLGSQMVFKRDFLDRLFPPGEPDKRFDLWFDDPYCTMNPLSAMFMKFLPLPDVRAFDNNYIYFRYAGVLLLRAEALADLGSDQEAIKLLNKVRARAGARLYTGSGGQILKDAIFIEEEKELLGEGHRWYYLVRTGRVMDANECEDHLTKAEFEQRAWTWPIPESAINSNPMITQNVYWIQ